MKYSALGNKPNISQSRSPCTSPSLQLDSRGFPCISYLIEKNGYNEVNYMFWDGITWNFKDVPMVYNSKDDIVYSPNSLVLDSSENPVIVFARRRAGGSKLYFCTYTNQWNFKTLDVGYNVGWIGVVRYDRNIDTDYSSSSTSSLSSVTTSSVSISSSSFSSSGVSSSSSKSTSSNSSRSTSSTSSSSIMDMSTSSIIDISTSSSSMNESNYFVVAYDTDNTEFNIYAVSGIWDFLSTKSYTLSSTNTLKIDICGKRIGIGFVDDVIKYNFFDINTETWDFASFTTLAYSSSFTDIATMDLRGYYTKEGDESRIYFVWVGTDSGNLEVCSAFVDNVGNEFPSDYNSIVLETATNDVIPNSSDIVVNSYITSSIDLNEDNPIIILGGSMFKYYVLSGSGVFRLWSSEYVDIEGHSSGLAPLSLQLKISSTIVPNISFVSEDDIYCFVQGTGSEFILSTPTVLILNKDGIFSGTYSSGLLSGTDIADTDNSYVGKTLIDNKIPLLIFSNRI